MTERWHWRDAEEMAQWLCMREEERSIMLFLARLPFASGRVVGQLAGVSKTSVYRALTSLRELDLITAIKPPVLAGRAPDLFYLTDLGLATIAIDRGIDLDHLVRQLHLRGDDLVSLLPRLAQLTATYELLGSLAASRPGRPGLLAWERPWRRRYLRPTAKAPVSVSLPAYVALSWDDGHGAYFLVPDRGSFPLRLYRPVLSHLSAYRRGQHRTFPTLLVATTGRRRVEGWRELLTDVSQIQRDAPLLVRIVSCEDLETGLAAFPTLDQELSPDQVTQRIGWHSLRPRCGKGRLPRPVGDALVAPSHNTSFDCLGRIALGRTPGDRALLDLVAHHPFLDQKQLATVFGWEEDRVRRHCNHLIRHGLMRLLGTGEVGDDGLELVELTVDGLELVAAHRGLSLAIAIRELGLVGGGPNNPLGARRKLIQHLAHTRGVDAIFVDLYRAARRLSAGGTDDAVIEWKNAAACSRSHLRPDAYGLFRRRGWLHGFFLEWDRGTLNARDYSKKFAAYYAYGISRRFERDYPGYPTILVVAADNATEERIARAAQAATVGRPQSLPLLLTCRWRIDDASNPHGPLGSIWREPDSPFDNRRHWITDARRARGGAGHRIEPVHERNRDGCRRSP